MKSTAEILKKMIEAGYVPGQYMNQDLCAKCGVKKKHCNCYKGVKSYAYKRGIHT